MDEICWGLAFRCCYVHINYLIMPVRLINPAAFLLSIMNDNLKSLANGVVAYIDNILTYSKSLTTHYLLL